MSLRINSRFAHAKHLRFLDHIAQALRTKATAVEGHELPAQIRELIQRVDERVVAQGQCADAGRSNGHGGP